jgi:hypothetical protein
MTRWQFEELLASRRIPRHYTEADLEEDIRHAHGGLSHRDVNECPGKSA